MLDFCNQIDIFSMESGQKYHATDIVANKIVEQKIPCFFIEKINNWEAFASNIFTLKWIDKQSNVCLTICFAKRMVSKYIFVFAKC